MRRTGDDDNCPTFASAVFASAVLLVAVDLSVVGGCDGAGFEPFFTPPSEPDSTRMRAGRMLQLRFCLLVPRAVVEVDALPAVKEIEGAEGAAADADADAAVPLLADFRSGVEPIAESMVVTSGKNSLRCTGRSGDSPCGYTGGRGGDDRNKDWCVGDVDGEEKSELAPLPLSLLLLGLTG